MKILKKYDKRTGALIRLPFIQRVLQQPFFSTDLLYKLVKECEAMLDGLFTKHVNEEDPSSLVQTARDPPNNVGDEGSDPTTSATASSSSSSSKDSSVPLRTPAELAEIKHMESLYVKSTISALRALKEIRSGSSTVSMFSLPPLQTSGLEESCKKIPILEQAAK